VKDAARKQPLKLRAAGCLIFQVVLHEPGDPPRKVSKQLAASPQGARDERIPLRRQFVAYNNNGRSGPLQGREVVSSLGVTGLAPNLPDINGTLNVSFSNITLTGIAQTDYRKPGFLNWTQQFQDQVSWYKGRHSVKAGANLAHIRFDDGQAPSNLFGAVTFSNRFTGHPYADFLLGLPTTSSRGFGFITQELRRWTYDFFVTDTFKVTPKLTLNLGARYELHPYWREINGRQATFDPASGRIVVPDGALSLVSPLLPRGYVDVVEASAAGYPSRNLVNTDKNNFAPRLGVAWRPIGNNTVVRAGFGVFYDVTTRSRSAGGVVPFLIAEPAFNNPATNPTVVFPRIFPDSVAGPATISIPAATDPNLLIPYTLQYNVTVEHQRWNTGFRASYVGTGQRQAEYTLNINQPVADSRLFVDKPRPFPRYPAINYVTNGAGHQFHGLSLEAERRTKGGMLWQLSYSLSRDIGDVDRGQGIENSYDRERERGVSLDIPAHRVSGSLIYELPFGRGRRVLSSQGRAVDALAGGWQVSVIALYTSGQFLTPLWTGPDPTGTVFTANRTPANVTLRPNLLRDPNLPSGQRTIDRWFDPTAFAPPTAGSFGTAARGVIVGPSSHVWHAGLYKAFSFTERVRLRLEMTANNVFNHVNYGNPNTNISQANAVGRITSIGGATSEFDLTTQRTVRLGARLEW
jgi:outer membrane receptor protein involved in Fe transport